ncbi:uncharacterized protein LOC109615369 isoform X2 [Esox lucius]|uniref:uncharacterized protein LOC109615369 isoform X2 n=1 Tax=Esox lucius TaxID=8010 RepID=UPI001476F69E|nr:uncharacterized protein LOC109615369 isoform X2 [Esox lucius]
MNGGNMAHLKLTGLFFLLTLACHFLRGLLVYGEPIQYSREFLLFLHRTSVCTVDSSAVIPTEILRLPDPYAGNWNQAHWTRPTARKRGRCGGVRQRLRRQGHMRIPLPTVILANVQSLRNKVDEHQANVKFLMEYSSACLLAFTETWLKEYDLKSDLDIDGFGVPYRLDRDSAVTDIFLEALLRLARGQDCDGCQNWGHWGSGYTSVATLRVIYQQEIARAPEPEDVQPRAVEPGDQVYIRVFKRRWNEPRKDENEKDHIEWSKQHQQRYE